MNYGRIALAGLGGTAAYLLFGGVVFGLLPQLRDEFRKYPDVYRTQQAMKGVMPVGMVAMLLAIAALAVIYATAYRGSSGLAEGARLGILGGIFAVGAFVLHNYVNLNIGTKITLQQAIAYFIQWVLVGIVIGLIYKPAANS